MARKTIDNGRKSDIKDAIAAASDKPAAQSAWTSSSKEYPHLRSLLAWTQENAADFLQGKNDSTTVDSWGRISPGLQELAQKPILRDMRIWSAVWSKGYFWFGTTNRILRWKGDDSSPEEVAHLKGLVIPSMAVDSKGIVYAAIAPSGRIYKIDPAKSPVSAQEIAQLPEQIITSLCFDDSDNLYAGVTGTGKVYKLAETQGKKLEQTVVFDSGQASVTALFYSNSDKRLYVGTAEKAAVYSIDKEGKSHAEYQSSDHIVTGIVRDTKGDLYVSTAASGHLVKLSHGTVTSLASSDAFYTLHYDATHDSVFSGDAEGDITQMRQDPLSHESFFLPVCHTEQEAVLALASKR